MASSLLERHINQLASVSTPSPVAPIVITRIRTGNRFHVHRRQHQHPRSRPIIPVSTQNSSQQSSSSPIVDNSRESLINLYCLFQDNLNSSKTDLV